MKKRILFVDDEINLLKGLQRSLRGMRSEWDMVFAASGRKALEVLEQERFDVILTDMRMPEMEGAELLQTVKERYPRMIRIILSGYSDQKMVMKSVKTAHQYLCKPWQTETLVHTVKRSCALHDFINPESLQRILGGIENVPSMPKTYRKIVALLNTGDASVASVGALISEDIGMTSKVLQLVNSSFFTIPGHVGDAKAAVNLLGIDVIRTLILNIEIFTAFSESAMSAADVAEIHRHCLRTSNIVSRISQFEHMEKDFQEKGMIAAMLHDIGMLILAKNHPEDYAAAVKKAVSEQWPLFRAEKAFFGAGHPEVGAYLLGLWGFRESIIEAVAYHHEPGRMTSDRLEVCGLLHAANLIDRGAHPRNGLRENVDIGYFESMKLRERLSFWKQHLADN